MLLLFWCCFYFSPCPDPAGAYLMLILVGLVCTWSWHTLISLCYLPQDRFPELAWPVSEVMCCLVFFPKSALGLGVLCLVAHVFGRWWQPLAVRSRWAIGRAAAGIRIRRQPSDLAGYHSLARILSDQGRPREAAEVLERLLRRAPDNLALRRQIEVLRAQGLAADTRAIGDLLPHGSSG